MEKPAVFHNLLPSHLWPGPSFVSLSGTETTVTPSPVSRYSPRESLCQTLSKTTVLGSRDLEGLKVSGTIKSKKWVRRRQKKCQSLIVAFLEFRCFLKVNFSEIVTEEHCQVQVHYKGWFYIVIHFFICYFRAWASTEISTEGQIVRVSFFVCVLYYNQMISLVFFLNKHLEKIKTNNELCLLTIIAKSQHLIIYSFEPNSEPHCCTGWLNMGTDVYLSPLYTILLLVHRIHS